ncbi:PepSY domain-containing protein [Seongchinamella sediminis]|uniref:PepSY domain-containing protein n=1 Tax=Seongchinamella sediminis TaxID=2283635 RepID=A0A3L7E0Q4_9GAMM|nr:PepSY-associated TM helix domain-containing protein [Seongchinamella sediminis]RLQ23358.1 PepSY domain-containing protein [Seongchinamella sediminis]
MALAPELVRRSLDAHSAIGLVVGVLMYLICLTGSLAAMAELFERWEQPGIPEFNQVSAAAVENAMTGFRASVDADPESLWVIFPTAELPRMHVSSGAEERFTDAAGKLLAPPAAGWTHMLRELHISLHLPHNIGLVIVSAIGAMLLALIVSGLLAHPRLFRDAFKLRLGGTRRLEQADIHNRLSVWGLPFHLMIGVTGAFYGLVGLLAWSAATAWYDGDTNALFDSIYGSDPVLEAPLQPLGIDRALAELERHHPEVQALYIVGHKLDTPGQFLEIAATVPGRLAYSEIYRFDAAGSYLGSQQLTTGPAGRQFLYSLYRIHFGYFGGLATRVTWLLLGLGLTVVAVSGINIWLARRGRDDALDRAWAGVVWGAPLALALSATAAIVFALAPLPVFAGVLAAAIGGGLSRRQTRHYRGALQWLLAASLLLLAGAHTLAYSPAAQRFDITAINLALAAAGLWSGWMAWRQRPQAPSTATAPEVSGAARASPGSHL